MKSYLATALVSAALACWATKQYWPTERVTQTVKTVTDTKVETKTVTKYVERPDGTKERIEFRDVNYLQLSKVDVAPAPKPDWTVGLLTNRQFDATSLVIGRRIFGNLFVTGELDTRGNFRAGALIEF